MADSGLPALPIAAVLPALAAALAQHPAAVLEAPTGAGKSTVAPLALLGESWLGERQILLLEPRRLAARAVASRMAATLGEPAGRRVGWRMRLDTRVSRETRIVVVTEGILARMLQQDPALDGVGLVIFDEFHERSLDADLGLALCLDAQRHLRDDLKLLVMSATLDGDAVAALLGGAPVVRSIGRSFPVEVRHARRAPEQLEREVGNTVRRALAEHEGDVLVFLPGAAEIRRVERNLADGELPPATVLRPLYGELPPEAQDAALAKAAAGTRKIVLATSIAETSLTIDGVTIVVDSGLARRSRFDPVSGMSRLETLPVSRAAAEQRRGRAGRLAPGVCYRVYTAAAERLLIGAAPAEMQEADLAPLALDLACWGTEPAALAWLDPPPPAHFAQARELLATLGALDASGRVTDDGRRMALLGLHPRLARMLLAARALHAVPLACELAALLADRDVARTRVGERDADLGKRLVLLGGGSVAGLEADRSALERARRLAGIWRRRLAADTAEEPPPAADAAATAGLLLAFAYPDRIGQRRSEAGRYLLSGGRGAAFAGPDALARSEYLVVAALDGGEREARIQLAAPVEREALLQHFSAHVATVERVEWDRREQAVVARRERRLGALVLEERPLAHAAPARQVAAMQDGIRALGLGALPWSAAAQLLRARVSFVRRLPAAAGASPWPDFSDAGLESSLDEWLAPYLGDVTRRDHLARLDLAMILRARLDAAAGQALERLAPTHLLVPSGSRIPIDYAGDGPSLAVRLQEMFGLTATPTVGGGRVPLSIALLSPAGRPVQVTRDLASFWARGYAEVRKELKGRYPKHYWPDDPHAAEPTARVRPRR
jgi:ATP-dependent helicase HrpB